MSSNEQRKKKKISLKNKLLAIFFLVVLVGSTAALVMQQNQINHLQYQIDELIKLDDEKANAGLDYSAHVYYIVRRAGTIVFAEDDPNVITDAGRTALRPYIGDTAGASFDYIEVGTGSGGGSGSTALVTPFSTRGAGTYATVGSFNFSITFQFTAGFFDGETITETGCFNAITGVTLLSYDDSFSRQLFAADDLTVIFMFQVGS